MKQRKLSREFKDFMLALKAWVDAGCPDPTVDQIKFGVGFRKNDSICFQNDRWAKDDDESFIIHKDLQHLFQQQFGKTDYPFNKKTSSSSSCSEEYGEEMNNKAHYQNPARLKWINDTVASFKEKNDESE